jgi:hypothetical protein
MHIECLVSDTSLKKEQVFGQLINVTGVTSSNLLILLLKTFEKLSPSVMW